MPVAISTTACLMALGVVTHITYTDGPYAKLSNVINDLNYLRLTHVRNVSFNPAGTMAGQAAYGTMALAGFRFDLVVSPATTTLAQTERLVDLFVQAHPGSVSAIEGPNEVDHFPILYDSLTGVAAAKAFQADLYGWVRADPMLAGVPVYDFTGGLDLSLKGQADAANIHPYPQHGVQPTAAIVSNIQAVTGGAVTEPSVITEDGYPSDIRTANGVPAADQAKMTLNMMLDGVRDGFAITYLYELLDEASDPGDTNSEYHFGLFNADGTPKPVATAIHNFTSVLYDVGTTAGGFTPTSLAYTVSGLPATGSALLMQKSSGVFDLALWNEIPGWDYKNKRDLAVTPTAVVTVSFGPTAATVKVFDPILGVSPVTTYVDVKSVTLPLSDHALVLEVSSPG